MVLVRVRSLHGLKGGCGTLSHAVLVPLFVAKDFLHYLILVLVSYRHLEGVLHFV
jgi:hypothetical protein